MPRGIPRGIFVRQRGCIGHAIVGWHIPRAIPGGMAIKACIRDERSLVARCSDRQARVAAAVDEERFALVLGEGYDFTDENLVIATRIGGMETAIE
jgi:hypothetical protein